MTNVVRELRSIAPACPLGLVESLRIAELQAERLLALCEVTEPPIATEVISQFPRVHVVRTHLEVSSAWKWTHGRWVILLNWTDSPLRQRFSLAHQFKHILDSPTCHLQYPTALGSPTARIAEQSADHFAGSLLMPERWLRNSMEAGDGGQRELSRMFEVSEAAIRVRLSALGLAPQSLSAETRVSP